MKLKEQYAHAYALMCTHSESLFKFAHVVEELYSRLHSILTNSYDKSKRPPMFNARPKKNRKFRQAFRASWPTSQAFQPANKTHPGGPVEQGGKKSDCASLCFGRLVRIACSFCRCLVGVLCGIEFSPLRQWALIFEKKCRHTQRSQRVLSVPRKREEVYAKKVSKTVYFLGVDKWLYVIIKTVQERRAVAITMRMHTLFFGKRENSCH